MNYELYKKYVDFSVILYCCYEAYTQRLVNSPYILLIYSILDYPFNTTSLKIHHIACVLCSLLYICGEKRDYETQFLLKLLRFEYSTVFLQLHSYFNTVNIGIENHKYVNQLFFVCTFTYYRIYNMFTISTTVDMAELGIAYCALFCTLYLLNLYWYVKIAHKYARLIYWTEYDTHFCAQYMYALLPITNVYFYPRYITMLHCIDIMTISFYSSICHFYRRDYYQSLSKKMPVNPHYYFYEKIATHIRSATGLFVVCYVNETLVSYILIIMSFVMHTNMCYYFYIDYYKEFHIPPHVLKHQKMIYKIPVYFDNICLFALCDYYHQIVIVTALITFAFITYVQPFGKNSHHLLFLPFLSNYLIACQSA